MPKKFSDDKHDERVSVVRKIMETHFSIVSILQSIRKLIDKEDNSERHKKSSVI